jgi:RimJ/RimL family protein N-acetyltransferase
MTELLTERLHLRPFRPGDFEAHAAICADPEVMRFIRAGALSRSDAWWQLARYMGHWQLRGYGLWAVVERATDRLVGHLGFLDPEGGHGFEMGWALAREAWGRGYALEGTREALRYAFTTLKKDHVTCVIRPDNARSIRLAERLGARLERDFEEAGVRLLDYGIARSAAQGPGPGRT